MKLEHLLRRKFPELKLLLNRPTRELTSFGVGTAPVPLLADVTSETELAALLKFLYHRKIKTFFLGAGTNIVGSDTPFDGVMIRLSGEEFTRISVENELVFCGAATRLPLLATVTAKAGLSGFAPLSGIPGTIGGALHMNAGANGCEISALINHLYGVTAEGELWESPAEKIEWFYRSNTIPPGVFITRAVFKLTAGKADSETAQIAAETDRRRRREPAGHSAGCAFRNVSPQEPAGMLIDRCGLRELQIGDLQISGKHANYLINLGNASESDYIRMIRIIRRAVSEKYGFHLINEIVPITPETTKLIELDTPPPRINVLYGGNSSEREISLQSGDTVAQALRHAGFKVELSDIRSCDISAAMRQSDVIYPVLHGGFGENGDLQKKLEDAKLRFVGSGSAACRLVMDKLETKKLLQELGLPTAPWAKITKTEPDFPASLRFPVMLKAPCEGSTVGIVKVNNVEEWEDALEKEFKYSDELLVEEFIEGVEITVPVLNSTVLEAIEIVSPTGFYDWDAKYVYNNGQTRYLMPPQSISPETTAYAKELALKFYHATRSRDILRVDFIVGKDNIPRILEGNSIPGNTSHSLVPQSARESGISMEKLTSSLVYAAMKRSGEPEGLISRPHTAKTAGQIIFNSMLFCTKWLFRLVMLFCAMLLFTTARRLYQIEPTISFPLFMGGTLLICAELIFYYLKTMEKK